MKNTIQNTVKEVYNTNLKNMKVNPSLNMLKDEKNENEPINENYTGDNSRFAKNMIVHSLQPQNNSFILSFVSFFLLASILGVIYYLRDNIRDYFNKYFSKKRTISKEVVDIKENDEELKETKSVIQDKDKIIEKDKLSIIKDGEVIVQDKVVKERKKVSDENGLSKKGNNSSHANKNIHSPNQIVNQDDTYCYVGKDDDMRQCIQVFKGDICNSGDIFSRIDECILPQK